jgi:hypothetical protein
MSKKPPVFFDDDNPEWTEEDFARARPLSDFPELVAAFPKTKGGRLWKEENAAAMESSNSFVEQRRLPLDRHRQF